MTPRRAHILLAILATVAALEWISAASAYRSTLSQAAWDRAAAAIAPLTEPVLLGTPWLDPLARQHVPAFTRDAALVPDLHGVPRFHVLGHAGSPRAGAWSSELTEDQGELPPPILTASEHLGPLVLHHYEQPAAGALVTDLLAAPLQLRDDRGACRLSSGTWTCKLGTAQVRPLEVGHRPRRCLAIHLADSATLEISHPSLLLGTVLRGHLGFADFNSRLRNDAPAQLELHIDDTLAGRWTLTDNQGWVAFAARTTPGTHAVRVRLTPLLAGTWTPEGYTDHPARLACLELRALTEAAP